MLLLLSTSVFSQSFFLTSNSPSGIPVSATSPSVTFTWQTDSCAGQTPPGATLVNGQVAISTNLKCVSGSTVVFPNGAATFPQGFDTILLLRGQSRANAIDLKPTVVNNAALAGVFLIS